MTVTHRKRQHQPDEIQTVNEPGLQIQCDSCGRDLTHSIRIKCADPVCEPGDGVDICPACFCAGREFRKHKRGHAYRVVELHSYPIFSEDWGADEELLLMEGLSLQGLGNWQAIAEHVGTRTKEEVEQHYNDVYVNSPTWPLPRMDEEFNIDPVDFQERKRRRIATMTTTAPPPPKVAPTSAPGVHEVATFLPGRLEFEHELDHEAEDLVKDLEFGVCLEWGGDEILEDEHDQDVRARIRWEEEKRSAAMTGSPASKSPAVNGGLNGTVNGHHTNGDVKPDVRPKTEDPTDDGTGEGDGDEVTQPPPIETKESLTFKLSLLEMYSQRVDKRLEAKALMFDRGLLEYKKMQAAEKKRPKEEKDVVNRLRPFARLQTAEDYEVFVADILYESMLRKRIQELQHYRKMGLTTIADIEKYDLDNAKRVQAKANYIRDPTVLSDRFSARTAAGRQSSVGGDQRRGSFTSYAGESEGRRSHDRELTPKSAGINPAVSGTGPQGRKQPAPLNLANSPSLHLLTPAEQTLCSQLRILPKPYLVIKETLVREYARRGGKLRRREARDLVKIDVNKTSRVWDFLVQAGFLKITQEPNQTANAGGSTVTSQEHSGVSIPPQTSPPKESQMIPSISGSTYTNGIPSNTMAPTSIPGPAVLPWPPT